MLNIIWRAKFKDGSFINQYEKSGKEHLFKEVLDRQKELELFALINVISKESYIVNLNQGYITKTKVEEELIEPRADMLRKDQYEYRLIYFREVHKQFSTAFKLLETSIAHFVGFQYTDENNKNHKRMIKIQEDGKWVIN